MRYTRYDYKKKKGDNFVWWLLLVFILSIVIGIGIYNIFLLDGNKSDNGSISNEKILSTEDISFIAIQCGLYSNEQNAQELLKTIPEEYGTFIVKQDEKFKVIAGIFVKEEGEKKSIELTSNNIANFRINFDMSVKDTMIKTEGEIIQGYISIINKLYEKDVKSINTKEFKTWTEEVAEKTSNNEEINLLVDNIKKLPEEYNKEESIESVKFLYNILFKYKVS
jgi:hypothetical protein